MASRTLYILYNADASIMGKLKYGYRKIRKSSEDNPACAACDITHDGLSLQESPNWVEAKKVLQTESGYKVVQQHRDEISDEIKDFLRAANVRYPTILADKEEGGFTEVMVSSELAACKGNAQHLLNKLRDKGILQPKQAVSSL
ncbi:hypothetical protein EK21DRAFT_106997 [Setomelanomma holmii]|uniref:Uncharacterized protein n=1 Tax=Setomelanomma holmii TaxID=210430 RepID=A0A9P4HHT9_9PLEO|nr:hypothetical protein EK21DRAFT_106997 [Setomelanomma holmii]